MPDFSAMPSTPSLIWLLGGLALCIAETHIPGAFLIWIGIAGLIVGLVDYLHPIGVTPQMLLFAALVVGLVLIGRRVYGSLDPGAKELPLSRAHALVGNDYFLNEAIARGFGTIRVGDSVWRVTGDDCPAGAKVRVVAIEDGSLLRVAKTN
jgi:membrane protein implicated in regulation of membrane protease activity